MKIFKKIYFPIMAVLIVLVIIFGFLTQYGIGLTNSQGGSFLTRVEGHTQAISQREHRNSIGRFSIADFMVDEEQQIRNSQNDLAIVRDYITAELSALPRVTELQVREYEEENYSVVAVDVEGTNASLITVAVDSSSETLNEATPRDERTVFVRAMGFNTESIVLFVPGSNTRNNRPAQTAVFSVRIDAMGSEASNAMMVGILLEYAKQYAQRAVPNHSNDIVFVFADGGLENSVGLRTVLNQLRILRPDGSNAMVDVGFLAEFDTRGTNGSLVLVDAGGMPHETIRAAGSIGAVTNSFINYFELASREGEERGIHPGGDIAYLSFSTIGNLRNDRSRRDNFNNQSRASTRSSITVVGNVIDSFASANLSRISSSQDAVHFSYLNAFVVSYPSFVSYILVIIILSLLGAFIGLAVIKMKRKKAQELAAMQGGENAPHNGPQPNLVEKRRGSNMFLGMGMGVVIQLLAILIAAAALFILYAFMALLLAGFGVISIQAFTLFSFMNPGIIITAIMLFCIFMVAAYVPLKKAFNVKAPSLVRGSILINALLAIILGFAMPALAFPFIFLSIFQLSVMLIELIFKDRFKKKFKKPIDSLFLQVWPMIIALPIFISTLVLTSALTPFITLVGTVAMFSMIATPLLAYADWLKKGMAKFFGILPKQRVGREKEDVLAMLEALKEKVEKTEDEEEKKKYNAEIAALQSSLDKRKGKWVGVKEKWKYRHAYGIGIVAILAFIGFVLASAFGGGFHSRINSFHPTVHNFFSVGAINYVYEDGVDRFEVQDLSAQRSITRYVSGLRWNSGRNAYTAEVPSEFRSVASQFTPRAETGETNQMIFRTSRQRSRVSLMFSNMAFVEEIRIFGAPSLLVAQDDEDVDRTIVFRNTDNAETIKMYLPFGFADYISLRFSAIGTPAISVEYTEEIYREHSFLAQHDPIDAVLDQNTSSIADAVSVNMIFALRPRTLTLQS